MGNYKRTLRNIFRRINVEPTKKQVSTELLGSSAFRIIKVTLPPRTRIKTESGSMASQDVNLQVKTQMNGGFLSALMAKFFGGESFFINDYRNVSDKPATLYLTQTTPGDVLERTLQNETIFLEAGAFIAKTGAIKSETVWAGFVSFFAGEGLFRLKYSGTGTLWFGSYGAVVEKEILGDLLVDSHHLLAYPPTVQLSLKLAGGLFSSFLSKEGFVLKISGRGKVLLQTRSVKGLAQWLNSKFWG